MNWKGFLIGLGIGTSPMSVHAQKNSVPQPTNPHHTTVLTHHSIALSKDTTNTLDPISITVSDSTEDTSEHTNSVSINITDTISPKQWAKLTPRQKLESCSNLMFLFNIQFEDLRAKAYNDGCGNPTILNGMAYINGKKVKWGMSIKDFKKALQTWNNELNRDKGFFDVMEAYLGPAIATMKPTNEKELLQNKSALCAWLSFIWHEGQNVMGSSLYTNAINSAQHLAQQTGNKADIARADSLFKKYAKQFVQDYTEFCRTGNQEALNNFKKTFVNDYNKLTVTKRVKKNNGTYTRVKVKKEEPSFTRRREAERDIIESKCIFGIGECPECLKDDNSVTYINILDTYVGAIHSIGKVLPKDWANKVKNLQPKYKAHTIGDSLVTQYPELRPAQKGGTITTLQAKLQAAFKNANTK